VTIPLRVVEFQVNIKLSGVVFLDKFGKNVMVSGQYYTGGWITLELNRVSSILPQSLEHFYMGGISEVNTSVQMLK
jgi:hypothetical protein